MSVGLRFLWCLSNWKNRLNEYAKFNPNSTVILDTMTNVPKSVNYTDPVEN